MKKACKKSVPKLIHFNVSFGWKLKKFFNFPYADFQSNDNYNFQGDDTLVQPQRTERERERLGEG